MKMKKILVSFAATAALGMSLASAATVGIVNIGDLATKLPAFPAADQSMKAIEAKYAPQMQLAQKELEAAKTDAERQALEKKYAPVVQKFQEESAKATASLNEQIANALQKLEAQKKYDILIPMNLPADAQIQNATAAAIAAK